MIAESARALREHPRPDLVDRARTAVHAWMDDRTPLQRWFLQRYPCGQFVILNCGDGRGPRTAEITADLGYGVLVWVFGRQAQRWGTRQFEYPKGRIVRALDPASPADAALIGEARAVPR